METLPLLQKLQLLLCKNELYKLLLGILGPPEDSEGRDGYREDVDELISKYSALKNKSEESVVDFLDADINGSPDEKDEDSDESDSIPRDQLRRIYVALHSNLTAVDLERAVRLGAVAFAQKELVNQEEMIKEQLRRERNEEDEIARKNVERRRGVKLSAEELFRVAHLTRSGMMDEAVQLDMRAEDEEEGEQVELNEHEPEFLKGMVNTKAINYKAPLPSELLQRASNPTQRAAILERRDRMERQSIEAQSNSLKKSAQIQEQRNKVRQMMRTRDKRTKRDNSQSNAPAHGAGAGGDAEEQANGETSLINSEQTGMPEERGFRSAKELPSNLPPWMRENFGEAPSFGYHSKLTLDEQRRGLPIYAFKDRFLEYVDAHSTTILIGETGSGKTTQIPQYLAEHGYADRGVICCTQPRRVAAETLAKRVAEEYGCRLGEEVGFTVRFRDVTSSLTKIKYVTDGMLLREALLDDTFERYSVVMIDEAHERSINTDLLFGIVRAAVQKRPTLKVIITSATLDREKFCSYFGTEDVFFVEGRTFPVEMWFLSSQVQDYLNEAFKTAMMIHMQEPPGDVLVFLTGQEEIEVVGERLFRWIEDLKRAAGSFPIPDLLILPLTATMPEEVQSKVFEDTPIGCRKVVLATNVAETSITIPNLLYVVDSGFCKQNLFDARTGIEQLRIVPVSQAQAMQRSGRAGRIAAGKAYRLYTELQFHDEMEPSTVPDIQRSNLFNVVLQLKAMGINDLFEFEFMDFPPKETLVLALQKLRYLEALDDNGLLTPVGGRMAQLPVDPSQSKTLLTAVDMGCSEPVLTIVSMLAVQRRGVFYRPRDQQERADAVKRTFYQPEGDQITLMAVYDAWVQNGMSEQWSKEHYLKHRLLVEAKDTREQLKDMLLKRHKSISHHHDYDLVAVRRAFTAGYFFNSARRLNADAYVTFADRREVYLHPSSSMHDSPPKFVIYDELQMTNREYMREVVAIEASWLAELAPAFFRKPDKGQLTKAQRAERMTPMLKAWEAGNMWRISNLKKMQQQTHR